MRRSNCYYEYIGELWAMSRYYATVGAEASYWRRCTSVDTQRFTPRAGRDSVLDSMKTIPNVSVIYLDWRSGTSEHALSDGVSPFAQVPWLWPQRTGTRRLSRRCWRPARRWTGRMKTVRSTWQGFVRSLVRAYIKTGRLFRLCAGAHHNRRAGTLHKCCDWRTTDPT
jgi:hypothetical protein